MQATQPATKQQTKRKRGGQPGNSNALRHGFYSRKWRDEEHQDLDLVKIQGLEDEIKLLRIWLRRTTEIADGVEDLDSAIEILTIVGIASQKLAGMLRTQKFLGAEGDGMTAALNSTIDEILREWGRK